MRKRLLLLQEGEEEGSSHPPGAVVFPEGAVATAGDPFQGVVAWFDDDHRGGDLDLGMGMGGMDLLGHDMAGRHDAGAFEDSSSSTTPS